MENTTKIKQYIRHIAPQPYTEVRLGRVVSVEGDTCTVDIDGLEIDGVSLRPVQDDSDMPLRITPKVKSFVIVADLTEGRQRQHQTQPRGLHRHPAALLPPYRPRHPRRHPVGRNLHAAGGHKKTGAAKRLPLE
ncbi:MAG: hypothetical protein IJ620_02255 [Bacteroidales bacterium]|nr:hypothetical protein [Bacteroidales bacterium]